MRKRINGCKLLVRKAKGIDEETILKLILRKCGVMVWTGVTWFRISPIVGSFEHSNELYIKSREFLDQLSKKNSGRSLQMFGWTYCLHLWSRRLRQHISLKCY
jgi:hypothetical protein